MTNFGKKRIFITGATSFIGAHLVQRFYCEGAIVCGLISPANKLARLKSLSRKIILRKGDLRDFNFVRDVTRSFRPELIFHLGSFGVQPGQTDIRRLAEINVLGTANLLCALQDSDFECFINTGTSAEYGPAATPMKESQKIEPATLYGATKAGATLLAHAFGKINHRNVITLRPFYVYGPQEEPTRFVSTVVRAALLNQELKITSLNEKRDFVYIEDVIEAFCLASKAGVHDRIFNVGTSREHTFHEVIRLIEAHTGKRIRIKEGAFPERPWKSMCWASDIRSVRKDLGWKPKNTLAQGLKKTIDWLCCNQDRAKINH